MQVYKIACVCQRLQAECDQEPADLVALSLMCGTIVKPAGTGEQANRIGEPIHAGLLHFLYSFGKRRKPTAKVIQDLVHVQFSVPEMEVLTRRQRGSPEWVKVKHLGQNWAARHSPGKWMAAMTEKNRTVHDN